MLLPRCLGTTKKVALILPSVMPYFENAFTTWIDGLCRYEVVKRISEKCVRVKKHVF